MKTKIDALIPIDNHWFIEPNYGMNAFLALQAIEIDAGISTERGTPSDIGPYDVLPGGVARIFMTGPLTKKDSSANWMLGGTATIRVRRAIESAVKDPMVKSILMYIDTPGGQCQGLSDLADDISAAKEKKPIVAYLSDLCASAGYYVASQCTEIVANRTALIGCIGTLSVLVDSSKMAEKKGLQVIVVSSGGVKGMGTPGTEITEEHKAEAQKIVDGYSQQFFSVVARGRGMAIEDVQEIGTGECWFADDALKMGLIDSIESEDTLLTRMKSAMTGTGTAFPVRTSQAKALAASEATVIQPMNKPTLWDRILAFARKSDAQALAEAGIDPDELNTANLSIAQTEEPAAAAASPTVSPEIKAQLEEMSARIAKSESSVVTAAAEKFVEKLLVEGKCVRAQAPYIQSVFVNSAKADGPIFDESGHLQDGPNLEAFKKTFDEAPKHALYQGAIGGENPTEDAAEPRPDIVKSLLEATSLGRTIISNKMASGKSEAAK